MNDEKVQVIRSSLLRWYDKNKRDLPWRAKGRERPDPYAVWLSEIMLQQTTVTAVKPYFEKFLDRWPRVHDLADAKQEEVMEAWAGLGYYARARNLHKCAQVVSSEHAGVFPREQKALKELPGIGDYTSAAMMTIAYDKPATVMDGNIERIMARLFAVETPLPKAKPELKGLAAQFFDADAADEPRRYGDLAQAMMDLGATICIPKAPRCSLCPVSNVCKAKDKVIETLLPNKEKKKVQPRRIGGIYWVEDEKGGVLLHRRPQKGLLGGMLGLPTSEWAELPKDKSPSKKKSLLKYEELHNLIAHPEFLESIESLNLSVRHIFTHFDLELILYKASLNDQEETLKAKGYWLENVKNIDEKAFPSVFRKALNAYFTAF